MKKISANRSIAALDFSSGSAVALIAQKKMDDTFYVTGAGEAPLEGISKGNIQNIGDVVESAVEALRKAETSAGEKIETLYFNFFDPALESVVTTASRNLSGEGEIKLADIREARKTALRMVSRFEKTAVYWKETGFVIDDHDAVLDPIGVFGRKLDVAVHVFLARSEHFEAWQRLLNRAGVEKSVPVFSSLSTAYGVLPQNDRQRKRLILELNQDFNSFFIFSKNAILSHCIVPSGQAREEVVSAVEELLLRHKDVEEVLITGSAASEEKKALYFSQKNDFPARVVSPHGVNKLESPKYASLVGLLFVADEIEKRLPSISRDRKLILDVREKALSFINEYF